MCFVFPSPGYVCKIDSWNKRQLCCIKMKISTPTPAYERISSSKNEDKRQLVTVSEGVSLCRNEKATHVEGAKAIFSGRQISSGPPTSAPRRRSLGYLISKCAACRCAGLATQNETGLQRISIFSNINMICKQFPVSFEQISHFVPMRYHFAMIPINTNEIVANN